MSFVCVCTCIGGDGSEFVCSSRHNGQFALDFLGCGNRFLFRGCNSNVTYVPDVPLLYASFRQSFVLFCFAVGMVLNFVAAMVISCTYRVSKTHRMPHLYRSFSAKELNN